MNKLKSFLKEHYDLTIIDKVLLRKMIGEVYKVDTPFRSYVIKLYKNEQELLAKRSVSMMKLAKSEGLFVPRIYPNNKGEYLFYFDDKIGFLMDYLQGSSPQKSRVKDLALFTNTLHKTMNNLSIDNKEILGKDFYINRFFSLEELNTYDEQKKAHWKNLLEEYYQRVESELGSFSHGDLHNENILEAKDGTFSIIDFDQATYTSSLIDLACITDQTNFNKFKEEDFQATIDYIQTFMQYYKVNPYKVEDIVSWIPIRHVELIATITLVKNDGLSQAFLDQQYTWILAFDKALKQAINR